MLYNVDNLISEAVDMEEAYAMFTFSDWDLLDKKAVCFVNES